MFLEDLSNPGKSPPQLTLFQSLFTHKLGCSFNTKRQIPQNREDREVFFGRRCKIRHQGEQSHPSSLSRSCQDTTPDQKALPLAVFRYVYAHDIFLFFAYLSYLFTKTWTPNEKKNKSGVLRLEPEHKSQEGDCRAQGGGQVSRIIFQHKAVSFLPSYK